MNILLIVFLVSISDIATKWWAFMRSPDISLLGDWLELTYIENTGVAFSTQIPAIHIIIPLILGILSVFIAKSWKQISHFDKIGYSLLLTGGYLNALERGIYGAVTDMISVKYFAIFNIADMAVTSGVILLLISSILSRKNTN